MKNIFCLLLASLLLFQFTGHAQKKVKPVVIAYVGGYRGIAHTDSIEADKLSHINYAFVDVRNNRAWLHNEITDTANLKNLVALKKINPDLKY